MHKRILFIIQRLLHSPEQTTIEPVHLVIYEASKPLRFIHLGHSEEASPTPTSRHLPVDLYNFLVNVP